MLKLQCNEYWRARVLASCRRLLATRSQAAVKDSEYSDEPQYPQIQDLSFRAKKQREAESWHEQIRAVPTVEEKLIKINMPRYYGFKVVDLGDGTLPYNGLPAMQHYTRTVFESPKAVEENAADAPKQESPQFESFLQATKTEVQDALELAHDYLRHRTKTASDALLTPAEREHIVVQAIIEHVNRAIINSLSADLPQLKELEVDYNPRHEAFWVVGGIDPPKNVVKSKKGNDWQKEMANDAVDRSLQYRGQPYLALRHRLQLPTWKSESELENIELAKQIPRFNYDPRTLGYTTSNRHGTNIPGFWPGSSKIFGCISYQSRASLLMRPESYGAEDQTEALHTQAIQSSFAWLLGQANYNGFNTYCDLTYPMNTQTIITDGRIWSFYEYQLNTLLLHSHHVDDNPRVNYCRGTNEMELYQEINEDGKCVGFNDDVLRHLLKFYTNVPTIERSSEELQPYLHPQLKHIADYSNEEQRSFLERTYKHVASNRPRHLAEPEIYMWERIYKINNKTRQLDAKRRFFEVHINPWQRTLDQHQKEYIPKAVRPEGPKSKNRWKKMYYP